MLLPACWPWGVSRVCVCLGVCPGGCVYPGGVWLCVSVWCVCVCDQGMCVCVCVCIQGVCTPTPWTQRQTPSPFCGQAPVKTLPCPKLYLQAITRRHFSGMPTVGPKGTYPRGWEVPEWRWEGSPSEQVWTRPGSINMGPPVNRQTHTTDDITLLQHCWRTVMKPRVIALQIQGFLSRHLAFVSGIILK